MHISDKPIYLDYNATTPLDPEVISCMRPYLDEYFGNPSSSHLYGTTTKMAVENARQQTASLINCSVEELVFTSGGSESNNYALKGAAYANKDKGNHIITSVIEHPAVTEVLKFLEKDGFRISFVLVDEKGVLDVNALEKEICEDTILISIMHANNEVGSIQPIKAIADLIQNKDILFHVDAAQSIGKVMVDVKDLGIDLLSIAAHKFYGPKGIGALFVRKGVVLEKLIHGADHERNLRAGTENVLNIVGLGKAAELALNGLEKNQQHMRELRDRMLEGIKASGVQFVVNGDLNTCLPNTLSISFKGVEANAILSALPNIASSAGAACHSDTVSVSHVLSAMKVPEVYAMGTIRLSTGKMLTADQVDDAVKAIVEVVQQLQGTVEDTEEKEEVNTYNVKLTEFTHGLGCACKIRPQYLEKVLQSLPAFHDEKVMVGCANGDDAAVYRIDEEKALVQTLDFFTPIVDDPYHFGAIAAANALSDVYAMGAKPIFGLNITAFPDHRLPVDVLKQILKGASDKAAEAGIGILGGHTIEDNEPKYGMVVSGIVDLDKVLSNEKAKPNHTLILTKPIGLGILSTALKRGMLSKEREEEIIGIMSTLNKYAAEIMLKYHPSCCTDVTGFGLIGHALEVCEASGVTMKINWEKVPLIDDAYHFAAAGIVPGGSQNNLIHSDGKVAYAEAVSETAKIMLADAQTSGGLLIGIPNEEVDALLNEMNEAGIPAAIIGETLEKKEHCIIVE